MKKTFLFLIVPVLMLQCTGTDETGGKSKSSIKVTTDLVNEHFGGVGFHVIFHTQKPTQWHYEQVFAKRWRELNPSFARVNDNPRWDKKEIDRMAGYLEMMKNTNTEIYLTSFGVQSINEYKNESEYVKREVDNIEYFVKEKGFTNIRNYCMTNELSIEAWASMVKNNELERFKRIHQLFYDEFKSRGLDIKLLATDASPFVYWPTIEWAAQNMDEITGVYGGHHYINEYHLDDLTFYSYFLSKMKWGADLAKSRNKKFIMGEFGPKQGSYFMDSVYYDGMIYNNTPLEPYVGLQLSEAIIAQINGGIYASCYWTFCDMPNIPANREFGYRANKWGTFKWYFDDHTTKPNYYSVGLLTKFFRGPAEVYKIEVSDTLLRVGAIRNLENGSYSVAIVNRNHSSQQIDLSVEGIAEGAVFRKYIYDPENVPFNHFGDLQEYSEKLEVKGGKITDEIPAYSLIVFTTNYDDNPPAAVRGMKVEQKEVDKYQANVVSWEPNNEQDLCYYRIYRSVEEKVEIIPRNEIGTTVASEYVDKRIRSLPPFHYRIIAVDKSGNSSE
ncbi:MAG TPA: hypothetical protein VI583_17810 [Cyclobacteriaceae bacterium]|nr:hypothetical protein [Cyclobacteriaceae bacterium]